jgi:hypothetical protein
MSRVPAGTASAGRRQRPPGSRRAAPAGGAGIDEANASVRPQVTTQELYKYRAGCLKTGVAGRWLSAIGRRGGPRGTTNGERQTKEATPPLTALERAVIADAATDTREHQQA